MCLYVAALEAYNAIEKGSINSSNYGTWNIGMA